MLDVWSISLGGWRMVRANQWIRLDGSRNILARLDHCHIDDFSSEIAHLRARTLNIDGKLQITHTLNQALDPVEYPSLEYPLTGVIENAAAILA